MKPVTVLCCMFLLAFGVGVGGGGGWFDHAQNQPRSQGLSSRDSGNEVDAKPGKIPKVVIFPHIANYVI